MIKLYGAENITRMSLDILDKTIVINKVKVHFRYNTEKNYVAFDLYNLNGTPIRYHNKVVSYYDFGGFFFASDEPNNGELCTAEFIRDWNIVMESL